MVDDEGLREVGLEDGATALQIRNYGAGEEIVAEGEQSDYFYVVLSGNVKISRHERHLSILGERDVFGLESCLLDQPSRISARSVENSRIAIYDKKAVDFILYERPQMSRGMMMSLLGQLNQTIQATEREEPREATDSIDIRFCSDGEAIIREGVRETDIFKLVSTERGLEVTKGGKEIGLILTPGEFFGEMASILKQERSATITSKGESVVQVYSAEHIQDMIEEHPEVARRMIGTLAKRLSQAIKKITRLQKELETSTRSES